MLTIVIAKPRQVTKVSAVPRFSCGAVCATSAENCGESAITAIPQISMKGRKMAAPVFINSEYTIQQLPDKSNA